MFILLVHFVKLISTLKYIVCRGYMLRQAVLSVFVSSQSGRILKLLHIEKDPEVYLYFIVVSPLNTSPGTSCGSFSSPNPERNRTCRWKILNPWEL